MEIYRITDSKGLTVWDSHIGVKREYAAGVLSHLSLKGTYYLLRLSTVKGKPVWLGVRTALWKVYAGQ